MIGLALLAPVTTGAQIGAIIGISLNAPPRRLFVLMSLGGLLWANHLRRADLARRGSQSALSTTTAPSTHPTRFVRVHV